jgi:anti-sigma factor RsiW
VTCKELADFIIDYLDGELPAGVHDVFQAHLEDCPPCKWYLDTYQTTIRLGREAFLEEGGRGCGEIPEDLVRAILDARRRG